MNDIDNTDKQVKYNIIHNVNLIIVYISISYKCTGCYPSHWTSRDVQYWFLLDYASIVCILHHMPHVMHMLYHVHGY